VAFQFMVNSTAASFPVTIAISGLPTDRVITIMKARLEATTTNGTDGALTQTKVYMADLDNVGGAAVSSACSVAIGIVGRTTLNWSRPVPTLYESTATILTISQVGAGSTVPFEYLITVYVKMGRQIPA